MAAARAQKPPKELQPSGQGAALDGVQVGVQAGVQVGMVYGGALVYGQGHEPANAHPGGPQSRNPGRLEEDS